MKTCRAAVVVVAMVTLAPEACADPTPADLRRAMMLFAEGVKRLQSNDWATGCERFEASAALVPRASSLVKIGICRRRAHRYVAAWQALQAAHFLNDAERPRRPALEQEIQSELAGIPMLRIALTESPAELVLKLDGESLPRQRWASELPLELGDHELTAHALGYQSLTVTFRCESEVLQTVGLRLVAEPLAPTPGPVASLLPTLRPPTPLSAAQTAQEAGVRFERSPTAARSASLSSQRITGLVVGAVGGVGLVASGVLGALTLVRVGESNHHCAYPDGTCDARGVSLRNGARDLQAAGLVVAGVSALVAGAGAALYFSAPESRVASRGLPRLVLGADLASAGLSLRGNLAW